MKVKSSKICPGCFESFTPADMRLRYCSKYCKRLVDWEWREARMLDTGATDTQLEKHRRYHPKYRVGKKLSPSDEEDMRAYMRTMAEIRQERIKASRKDPVNLSELIERDKGICHICGGKVSARAKKGKGNGWQGDPKYPTIDHVIPLSRDGAHTWGNVKLAHWKCNVKKGGRIIK